MNAWKSPFAMLMLFGFAAVMPILMHWTQQRTGGLRMETAFMAKFTVVAIVAIAIVSWIQPRGGR